MTARNEWNQRPQEEIKEKKDKLEQEGWETMETITTKIKENTDEGKKQMEPKTTGRN